MVADGGYASCGIARVCQSRLSSSPNWQGRVPVPARASGGPARSGGPGWSARDCPVPRRCWTIPLHNGFPRGVAGWWVSVVPPGGPSTARAACSRLDFVNPAPVVGTSHRPYQLFGLFSVVTLAADILIEQRGGMAPRTTAWYDKTSPSFADAIALVRRHLWVQQGTFTEILHCRG